MAKENIQELGNIDKIKLSILKVLKQEKEEILTQEDWLDIINFPFKDRKQILKEVRKGKSNLLSIKGFANKCKDFPKKELFFFWIETNHVGLVKSTKELDLITELIFTKNKVVLK